MKNLFLVLVFIGLGVTGWFYRETISGWIGKKTTEETKAGEDALPAGPGKPAATPNPALEAVAQARKAYPALAKAGSAFNLRFVALYNEAKGSNPDLLAQAKWPILLAERTAKELGGGVVPMAGPATAKKASAIVGWTDNYAAAVESAKTEDKKLLLDFTGSDWCGYCKALEKEVLVTSKFQTWARDNVVLVRVDFPEHFPQSSRVKQQNAELKTRYPVNGYPTILVVDTAGKVLSRRSGYDPGSGPDAFIASLDKTVKNR